MSATPLALGAADLFGLFAHFLVLSLLSVGGAIATEALNWVSLSQCCWVTT
jgi:hypothetical protein